jgi:anti-anti-sigma regulatory factor
MLRITVDDHGSAIHLKLEGRLTGAWVTELEHCWHSYSSGVPRRDLIVDLTSTDFVDLAGKYLLKLMYQRGATFTARTPIMKDLVTEIAGAGAESTPQAPR